MHGVRNRLQALAKAERTQASGPARRLEVAGILFDWTRLGLSDPVVAALGDWVAEADVAGWRDRMVRGEIVNPSERRAATHMALRDPARRAEAAPVLARAAALRASGLTHFLHLGIGGSALGPALLLDALGRDGDGPEVRVVANVDGAALADALRGLEPERTGIIVVSKTFTTLETRLNLDSALAWLEAGGVDGPWQRVTAVTAAPRLALAAGVPAEAILPFEASVGGRYSLWSAVGLPLAVRAGPAAFEALLDGAAAMDRHFLEAPFAANAPMLAGAFDTWFAHILERPTRGVFAYDERLRLLPSYLQQLEMESNGKSVARDGTPVDGPTAPITWGGTGTDAQHAVFQLLHQGSHLAPVEFVAVAVPGHTLAPAHHQQLLANCLAQGRALAEGRPFEAVLAEAGGDEVLARARAFPGGRPSSTILLDRLTPARLGALLAFHEARTFTAAMLLSLNPFDQWGVELGKAMARGIADGTQAPDAVTAALLAFIARAQAMGPERTDSHQARAE
ncbi:glucose-6-phosphate isomerase [Thermaurantiacus sp.]